MTIFLNILKRYINHTQPEVVVNIKHFTDNAIATGVTIKNNFNTH